MALTAAPALAGTLTHNSKAPDWSAASVGEKVDWLALLARAAPEINLVAVRFCLDENAGTPVLRNNTLAELSAMCATFDNAYREADKHR